MNSANVPSSELNRAISDARAILAASGVSKSDAQAIANDLRAIASEAQKNIRGAGKGNQTATTSRTRARADLETRIRLPAACLSLGLGAEPISGEFHLKQPLT